MTGLEIAVGYMAAWAWRKARRVAGRADAEIDTALDAGMDRLHDAVAAKLAGDRALTRLETEAGTDLDQIGVRDQTRQWLLLALQDAVENDAVFAARLDEVVAEVSALQEASGTGPPAGVVASGDRSIAAGGDISGIASAGDSAVNIQRR